MADLRRKGVGTEYATVTPAAWRSLCPGTHEGRCWQTRRHAWSHSWLAPGVWVMSDGHRAATGGAGRVGVGAGWSGCREQAQGSGQLG